MSSRQSNRQKSTNQQKASPSQRKNRVRVWLGVGASVTVGCISIIANLAQISDFVISVCEKYHTPGKSGVCQNLEKDQVPTGTQKTAEAVPPPVSSPRLHKLPKFLPSQPQAISSPLKENGNLPKFNKSQSNLPKFKRSQEEINQKN